MGVLRVGGAGRAGRTSRSAVATLLVLAVAAVVAVAALAVPAGVRGGVVLAALACSGPLVVLAVRAHAPRRRGQWLCVALAGAGLAAWFAGALTTTAPLAVAGGVVMYASLAMAAHVAVGRERTHRWLLAIDVLSVAAVAAAVATWVRSAVADPPALWAVLLAAGDLALISYLVALLLYRVRVTAPVRLVGGALGLLVVDHVVLWTQGVAAATTSPWSAVLVGTAGLTVAAAAHPAMASFGDVASPLAPPRRRVAAVAGVVLVLPVLGLLVSLGALPQPDRVVGAVLAGAVLVTVAATVLGLVLSSSAERGLLLVDPLTRAGSRLALQQVLTTQIHQGTAPVRLCVVDLDDVTTLAQRQGRQAADDLLVERVRRLRAGLPEAVVCRMAAQTLAVLAPVSARRGESPAPLAFVASVQAALAGEGHEVSPAQTTAAVLTVPPRGPDAEQGLSTDEMVDRVVEHAELSLLEAHDRGGPVEADLDRSGKYARERRLDTDLAAALGTRQIAVHYQPLVCPVTGRVRSLEALVRWQHPDLGLVAPDDFLAVAELQGLARELDDLARRQALADYAGWDAAGCAPDHVAVNLSAASLEHAELVTRVGDDLARSGVDPQRLVLEVVEQRELRDLRAVAARLEELRGTGVRIAIDDFGTGHAVLQYLLLFPVDTVKLDRSLVAEVGTRYGRTLLESAVTLIGSLGATAVAEGVEDAEQLRAVAELGFGLAQGFYCGRPLPAEQTAARLVADARAEGRAVGPLGGAGPGDARQALEARPVVRTSPHSS